MLNKEWNISSISNTKFFYIINSSLVFIVIAILTIVFIILQPSFISNMNLVDLLDSVAVIAVLSIGQTFVIATAGIDLSQGSVIGLAGVLGASQMGGATGDFSNMIIGIIVALCVGLVVGFINGFLVAFTRIPAFIVTLGTLSIVGGSALLITGGEPIYQLPAAFDAFGIGTFSIFPFIILISTFLAIVGQIILGKTRFGRGVYAIGSNANAARLSGLPVKKNIILVYVISGFTSATGAILLTAYVNSALPTAGTNYELYSIAAVVIGGGSLFGGQGTVRASMLGVMLIGIIDNGTDLLGVSTYAKPVILGCVVILAVFVDSFRKKVAI